MEEKTRLFINRQLLSNYKDPTVLPTGKSGVLVPLNYKALLASGAQHWHASWDHLIKG